MKILVLGATGQLGSELQRSLASFGQLITLGTHDAHYYCDLQHTNELIKTLKQIRPSVIVNAAAYTTVDQAQKNPEMARRINAVVPSVLAHEAAAINAWLIHYSTDYVFSGKGSRPWVETDLAEPLSVYGQTKLEGDLAIQASGCKHLILRTSWLYGKNGKNFVRAILQRAQTQNHLAVVNDQFGAPSSASLIASLTAHALKQVMQRPELGGLYHVAAHGETSWFEYAKFVLEQAHLCGIPLRVMPDEIQPISSQVYGALAPRPANSRLNTDKFCTTFGVTLPPWQEGVAQLVAELAQ
ncbi:dTDP-4-dehydrorhamnose reductase [Pusillimonas sp. DMV24BSW_D]|uniref:dTDP-4-dehydrorhamnose reductase n=1 Tax=Neopusillimonas aestuarii TaxID=2716226 RepID=UPI00140B8127|nr:dTDP-4-dehydrorhamnose reductase [Pusillimonas sp. DMV24BSW_D]QIM48057.1 dTDP-4-dehydrorhamnose reductase [Pusillimonas sp. DMV24BSW_D]